MTGVGAGAAATGLTTGIVGSSVGMAAAFGAIGARSVGDRMSRRLGEICVPHSLCDGCQPLRKERSVI